MTPEQLAALSDQALDTLRVDVITEQERRRDLVALPAEIQRLNARLERAKRPTPPGPPA